MKAGSIIPMWPEGTLSWETRDRTRLDLDIYPGVGGTFTLYEDDGVTRAYTRGEYAEQTFTVATEADGFTVTIGPSTGAYAGRPLSRRYVLQIHQPVSSHDLVCRDTSDRGGITVVETPPISISESATFVLR